MLGCHDRPSSDMLLYPESGGTKRPRRATVSDGQEAYGPKIKEVASRVRPRIRRARASGAHMGRYSGAHVRSGNTRNATCALGDVRSVGAPARRGHGNGHALSGPLCSRRLLFAHSWFIGRLGGSGGPRHLGVDATLRPALHRAKAACLRGAAASSPRIMTVGENSTSASRSCQPCRLRPGADWSRLSRSS